MSKKDAREASSNAFLGQLIQPFLDGWFLTLALGGLYHLHPNWHCNFNYWTCVLIVTVGIILLPQGTSMTFYMRKILEKY